MATAQMNRQLLYNTVQIGSLSTIDKLDCSLGGVGLDDDVIVSVLLCGTLADVGVDSDEEKDGEEKDEVPDVEIGVDDCKGGSLFKECDRFGDNVGVFGGSLLAHSFLLTAR